MRRQIFINLFLIISSVTLFSQTTKRYDFIIYPFFSEPEEKNIIGWSIERIMFKDSTLIDNYRDGVFKQFNYKMKWKIKNGIWYYRHNRWRIYFDYIHLKKNIFWLEKGKRFKMIWIDTNYIDNENNIIFKLQLEPIGFSSISETYYFTLKDGIIAVKGDYFFIRNDKISCAQKLLMK